MSSNVVKLGDICKIGSSKRIKRDDYVENGIPFFRSKEIIELSKGNSISTELFIAKDQYNQINEKFGSPDTGDILITSVGTLGVAYQVEQSQLPFYFKDGNLTWLSQFSVDVNPRWVLYWLNSPEGQRKIDEISIGSTQRAITIVALKSIEVQLPHKDEQDRTVKILDSVTGKISTNNKTNQTLEQIAQAIFKSWFVDFDPVKAKINTLAAGGSADDAELVAMSVISAKTLDELNSLKASNPEAFNKLAQTAALFPAAMQDSELGEIPEGWEVKQLKDILELAYGKALKKTDRVDGDVPVYGSGGLTGYHNQSLVEGPGIIVGRKGTVGSVYWEPKAFYPIDTVFYVKPRAGYSLKYCHLVLQNLGLKDMNTDAAVPGLNRDNAYRLDVITPTKGVMNLFKEIMQSLQSNVDANNAQSASLESLRDTLLPKLLSGEIDLASEVTA
ncbi:restriction endonuclease subunit S [Vibrio vulnificus]|uniref:restriction endonuclease subunit S n=1 Tax=Vibrio vulnificus TaxID=672 RepID=UPI0021D935B2|nr:restriction endonuclease subunit S [Vibrio vulnificus]EHG1328982.1 restriction endonuclease subunit S [Vibrio vulnificus]EHK8977394.1 restriction endonuclease subunit S [Vibrio vulnificus]EHK9043454.1 restriction endonuclease subunit S [Vibrio vulnificus]EIA1287083.1 restriction endonuclease subunit S [Vibrio vulnificus]